MIKTPLAYLASIVFYLVFGFVLIVFHVIQWLTLNLGGYQPHKKSVDLLNYCILKCLNLLGTTITFENPHSFSKKRPCIFIANHQSMFDIPPLIWHLRKYHPKFVSKKELGKGIPSISYNLKHGGSVLIDRKDTNQALNELNYFAEYLNKNNRSAVIFPEGTRSKTGVPKKFTRKGLQFLFEKMPDAQIVPITINNSWKLFKNGSFPLGLGVNLNIKVHPPVDKANLKIDDLLNSIESKITQEIKI